MIKVNLQQVGAHPAYNEVVEMPAVPRLGDSIEISEDVGCMDVRAVIWTPGNPDFDVQVRFW